jgi:hypothetical protein
MSKHIIVNAHGGWIADRSLIVPSGVYIYTYCNPDKTLYNDRAYAQWDLLKKKKAPGDYVGLPIRPGHTIPHIVCWDLGIIRASGIFNRGGKMLMDLAGVSKDKPVSIEHIWGTLRDPEKELHIHWLACTLHKNASDFVSLDSKPPKKTHIIFD